MKEGKKKNTLKSQVLGGDKTPTMPQDPRELDYTAVRRVRTVTEPGEGEGEGRHSQGAGHLTQVVHVLRVQLTAPLEHLERLLDLALGAQDQTLPTAPRGQTRG